MPDTPEILNEHNQPQNPSIRKETLPNPPIINAQTPNLPKNESAPTPKQPARRNSLKGLQQFNSSEYGHGE